MCNRLGLGFRVRDRVRLRVRFRVRLRANKLDVNYNIVTSPLYIGYSGPESFAACSTKPIITVTIKYVMYANKSLIVTLTLNPI